MNPTEFFDIYLSELLQKLSNDDKTIMLMEDFNTDLLKYDHNTDNVSFLDSFCKSIFKRSSATYLNTILCGTTF